MPGQPRVVLLKPLVTSPLIDVGEFSYYDDPDEPTAFETRTVLYHYGPEKLVIGKYCALGEGVRFIMNGANHRMDGPSTFPFPIMGGDWAGHFDAITGLPGRGDTVLGNDVWLGYRAMVMPGGVRIGHGAIVASGAVVVDDVPDYGIAGGNPAKLIRRRYRDEDVERLLAIAWWTGRWTTSRSASARSWPAASTTWRRPPPNSRSSVTWQACRVRYPRKPAEAPRCSCPQWTEPNPGC
ncbi:CatB-related O-acetyltransferase [Amycolatopsis rubida]|uniref:Virginiamycin A acetyltransferase n=1 Tax=Amycolatopsis rubida TaxID=112413 RepID=A0A1I5HX03_9PSEU|nr:virginiamycin A acetyltransferase [Amycolatopsis rubida]